MKVQHWAILSLLALFNCGTSAVADEVDPFAQVAPADEKQVTPMGFETTGAVKVAPVTGQNPEIIPQDEWGWRNLEKIERPTSFNRHFDVPFRIWRVDGGYFGAFDGGEWGGALFFAVDGAPKWTRIINTHIQDLERYDYESDIYLLLAASRISAYLAGRHTSFHVYRTGSGNLG